MRRKRRMRWPSERSSVMGKLPTGISFTKLCRFKRSSRSPLGRAPGFIECRCHFVRRTLHQLCDALCWLGATGLHFASHALSSSEALALLARRQSPSPPANGLQPQQFRIRSVCSKHWVRVPSIRLAAVRVGLPPSPALYLMLRRRKGIRFAEILSAWKTRWARLRVLRRWNLR